MQFGKLYYVALSPYCDSMDTIEEFRQSDFYFAAYEITINKDD